jgi:alanine racemase
MSAAVDANGALTRLTVDSQAIVENARRLRGVAPGASLAAVVKADAYGMGMGLVATALAADGCRDFFVATLAEGATLRRCLPNARIFVLGGFDRASATSFVSYTLIPVLNGLSEIEAARAAASARAAKLTVALHVDTGMNRLGLSAADVDRLAADRHAFEGLDVTLVMSHFACADDPAHPLTETQAQRFAAARAKLPPAAASLAASFGMFRSPAHHLDMVRPGCALYGINPTPEAANPMRPVCRFEARVLQVREIAPGETLGYGATYRAPRPLKVATVAAGYADGVLRSASNVGYAHAAGHRLPIIGRVSMDLITLDVTALPPGEVERLTWVTLLGPERPVDAVAAEVGTIGYEVLTRIGPRAQRVAGAL